MELFFLCVRNLLRNPKRSLITLLGIVVAACCTLLVYGFTQFTFDGLAEKFAFSGNGHLQIAQAKWFSSESPERFRVGKGRLLELQKKISADQELSRLISVFSLKRKISGVVGTSLKSEIFMGTGVDALAYEDLDTWNRLVKGDSLSQHAESGVILGKTLAERLEVKPGDLVSLLVSSDRGRTNAIELNVAGIQETGSKQLDAVALTIPISQVEKVMESNEVDSLVIGLHDTRLTTQAFEKLKKIVGNNLGTDLEIKTWEQVAEYYQGVKSIYTRIFGLILVFLVSVTVLAVANTLQMSIHERIEEVGILRALGMVPADILKLFTFEGLVFGLLGSFIGALFAVGISLIVSFLGGIPMPPPPGATQGYNLLFSIDSKGCLLVSALIIFCTSVTAFLSSWSVSKIEIATALCSRSVVIFLVSTSLLSGWHAQANSASDSLASGAAVLRAFDKAREIPKNGYTLESKFTIIEGKEKKETVVYKVAGIHGRNLAIATSDSPGSRMVILSAKGGMWMQKENMRKPLRISPAQRLLGQASNADVVGVQLGDDYTPHSFSKGVLTVVPKSDAINGSYAKIELKVSNRGSELIEKGVFYGSTGRAIKNVDYIYSDGRIKGMLISGADFSEQQTSVEFSQAKEEEWNEALFNSENILELTRRVLRK